jgi:hypothetical protein
VTEVRDVAAVELYLRRCCRSTHWVDNLQLQIAASAHHPATCAACSTQGYRQPRLWYTLAPARKHTHIPYTRTHSQTHARIYENTGPGIVVLTRKFHPHDDFDVYEAGVNQGDQHVLHNCWSQPTAAAEKLNHFDALVPVLCLDAFVLFVKPKEMEISTDVLKVQRTPAHTRVTRIRTCMQSTHTHTTHVHTNHRQSMEPNFNASSRCRMTRVSSKRTVRSGC